MDKSLFDLQASMPFSYAPLTCAHGWLKINAQMLNTMQAMADRWFGHRREALDDLLTAVSKMAQCKDPAEFAAAQQQWLAESSERLTREIAAIREDAIALAQSASLSLETLPDVVPRSPIPNPKKVA